MKSFPDVVLNDPGFAPFLWLLIPFGLAALFLALEPLSERLTKRFFHREVVGIGYILMGIGLFIGAMMFPFLQNYTNNLVENSAETELQSLGFHDVQFDTDTNTFDAYLNGNLIRGALIPTGDDDTYHVVITPPPT